MADPTPVLVALSTFPNADKAAEVARVLVEEALAACVNIATSPVRSIYRWKGQTYDEQETLVIIKTTRDRFEAMRARLVALHPYEVAEVIAMPVAAGHPPYVDWVTAQVAALAAE